MVEHGLALLIFIGRLGDVWSTHFITPTMVLEANPLVRRYKRSTFAVGFLLCLVPYFDVNLGIMVAVPFLLVTASNLSRAWMARILGEREIEALIFRAAARSTLGLALWLVWGVAVFFVLAASILWWLAAENDAAWYFATGMAIYALMYGIHGSLAVMRVFEQVRAKAKDAA